MAAKPQFRDPLDIFLHAGAHGGRAHFQFIDSGPIQGLCDGQFDRTVKGDAGRLFAVPQGGVDDPYLGGVVSC